MWSLCTSTRLSMKSHCRWRFNTSTITLCKIWSGNYDLKIFIVLHILYTQHTLQIMLCWFMLCSLLCYPARFCSSQSATNISLPAWMADVYPIVWPVMALTTVVIIVTRGVFVVSCRVRDSKWQTYKSVNLSATIIEILFFNTNMAQILYMLIGGRQGLV